MSAEPRRCGYQPCSRPLQRREGEKLSAFKGRQFCSVSCGARQHRGSTVPPDTPDRVCVCGAVMRRRDNESHMRFAKRRFCSPRCASQHPTPPARRERPPRETKTCAVCRGLMQRRETETRRRFGERETCSVGCGASLRRTKETGAALVDAVDTPKVCAYPGCGRALVRRDGEAPYKFVARRFCDRSCGTSNRNAGLGAPVGPESKPCAGCDTVMERGKTEAGPWRAKRFCSPGCASRSRHRVEPVVVPSADRLQPAPVPVVSGSSEVWRPPGWSKTPNAWAGHRPAEPDEVSA